jgi:predicted regulator of Ras-like GTPase activity (Roadblock/LC7/MglB family)
VIDVPVKKKGPQIEAAEQIDWAPKVEVKEHVADMRSVLDRIKTRKGIIGYILRASTSAAVDIKDPSKIIDYAVLSASALESAESLSEAFELGQLCNIVVEGKDLKILMLTIGEHRISIFMEKNVDHNSICEELT